MLKRINGVNKLMINGTPTNAIKSFKTLDAKYAVTNERTFQINLPKILFKSPARASGRPTRPATSAAGTVNKFNPGTKAVKNPLRMIGNKNNGANSMNGSPPNNALNNPIMNAATKAGIKLINPLIKNRIGNETNLRANFVRNVPINETNGKLSHVNGFKNANGPKIGANNNIDVNQTMNGTTISINESINIISGKPINKFNSDRSNVTNGAKKIVSIIKLKNGIKLGSANSAKAIRGNLFESNNNPSKFTNPRAVKANISGNANAFIKPRPPNNSG